jgi:hypothetical protein
MSFSIPHTEVHREALGKTLEEGEFVLCEREGCSDFVPQESEDEATEFRA